MESSLIFLTTVLSIFLALFLVLAIVLLVKAIQIANHVKHIIERTEVIVTKLDGAADFLKKTSSSLAIGKLVTKVVEHLSKSSKEDKEK